MQVPQIAVVTEQAGTYGALKMSQIANMIEAYGIAHPEIFAEQEKSPEEQERQTV